MPPEPPARDRWSNLVAQAQCQSNGIATQSQNVQPETLEPRRPAMQGRLLSDYFNNEGIMATKEWKESVRFPEHFRNFEATLRDKYRAIMRSKEPNEALTEQELIQPVMRALGWEHYIPQQGTDRNEDIPDLLLFADDESKSAALAQQTHNDRFKQALAIQENKRLYLNLDTRGDQSSSPHGQILRYLAAADDVSLGTIRWGILTNGKMWRLYDYRTRPRATAYYEADLRHALDAITTADDFNELRKFYLLFRREAFTPQEGATTTFLEKCLAEAKLFEERVAQDISGVVFERVFPNLVAALAKAANVHPAKAQQPALVLLYRILFIMFAEDRGLLPVEHPSYQDYGLRYWLREHERPKGAKLSYQRRNAYLHFRELCRIVDRGDQAIGVPAYNGNLFAEDYAEILETHELPDSDFIPIIRDLSHTNINGESRYINYRDMSVQQLGSIYERLLEREPIVDQEGNVKIVLNRHARKDSGSFYTPQPLVDLIVDQTLEPLVEDRLKAFEQKAQELNDDKRDTTERITELAQYDPAAAVLDLKILDPAMGSGHFLVTTVDFLADYIADLIEYSPCVPGWSDGQYQSPVATHINKIRDTVKKQATEHGWVVNESQLSDQAIIRRMVLKRSIYGVDKNPLTVELAKVALWLHSFTVGAPLSFLDHHLRCGDALVGMTTQRATQELNRLGGLFAQSAIKSAEKAADAIQRIEDIPDSIIEHVHESRALFNKAELKTAELRGILDFLCGLQWLTAGMTKTDKAEFEAPIADILEQSTNGAEKLLTCEQPAEPKTRSRRNRRTAQLFNQRRDDIRQAARSENFLHWEAAFPEVWQNWQHENPTGGFNAVIANPPWDRIKIQEREWLEQRGSDLAKLHTAAERTNALDNLRNQGSTLPDELNETRSRAILHSAWVRKSSVYPRLGRGDINLYSLFIERAESLIKPDGMIGLLTPAGVYADYTAAGFFRELSVNGRIRGIYDFENRRAFFREIHASFKFCVFAFSGPLRHFSAARCAFFLRDVAEIQDAHRSFIIEPSNFALVNPNTRTAPIFRNQRDADITLDIYLQHPVLIDRTSTEEQHAWPIRYNRMFDMSNDSSKFRTAAQLDADGYYPVARGMWKRGDDHYLPLFEGKMIQAYDHRAASVISNPDNLFRPGQPQDTSTEQRRDPSWSPTPRYWIDASECDWKADENWVLGFKEITAATNRRTFIAAIMPTVAFGNKVPLLRGTAKERHEYLLCANLNSFVFDFVTRQKIHNQTLNLYIVEQLPVLPLKDYDISIGDTTASELVRDHVLRLTYTANDIQAFARDIGYHGEPFAWDDNERMHLRARLDALYFMLYGISREDADYILSTFPIVQREDETQHGRFITRDLILAYMNCLEAGDTETIVNL